MSDNRFNDYPTKRMPSLKDKAEKRAAKHPKYDDYDEYDEDYDSDYDESSGTYNEGYDGYSDDYDNDYNDDDGYNDYEDAAYYTKPVARKTGGEAPKEARKPVRKPAAQKPRKKTPPGYGERRSKGKTAFIGIYIGLLVLAVAACIIAFVLLFQWITRESPMPDLLDRDQTVADNPTTDTAVPAGRPDIRTIASMITGISSDPRGLTLLNLDTLETTDIPFAEDATIANRGNNAMTFSELRIGQILEVRYDANLDEIISVREHAHSWTRAERTNVHVNLDNNTISVGTEAFRFNSQTLVIRRSDGERISISQISPADSVTIVGFGVGQDSTAWMVQIDASSGLLALTNFDEIVNGRVTIGNMHSLFLNDISAPIDVVEGPHAIRVEGENIETFTDSIVITAGQTLTFDLGGVQIRTANLNISTTPANASIYVNDELVTSPVQVGWGEHTIRVAHEGYITEERVVDIASPAVSQRFDLEALVRNATLTIFTSPFNADIYVNNERVGAANPNLVLELPPGSYSITARMAGHTDYFFSIGLASGQEVSRSITMVPVVVQPPTPPVDDTGDDTGDEDDSTNAPNLVIPPPPQQLPANP